MSWAGTSAPLEQSSVRLNASFVPALLRRRCSNLTRASLEVAYAVLDESERSEVETVFASRHGEGEVTTTILNQLASGEALSPNDFSLSVHNTASGLFSIFAKNPSASTALSGARLSLDAALLEMFSSFLRTGSSRDVLLVIADMPCPPVFGELGKDPAYALALLCSAKPDASALDCAAVWRDDAEASPTGGNEPGAVELLRWLFSISLVFESKESASRWRLIRSHSTWQQSFFPIAEQQTATPSSRAAST